MAGKPEFEAVVVGSGPNGLAAAIRLQQAGVKVLLIEGSSKIGGGLRTEELTLPGFKHDVCSAVHPMGNASPYFRSLPLEQHGLEYIHPTLCAAHPFDNGKAAILDVSLEKTAAYLGSDTQRYTRLYQSIIQSWPEIGEELLAPLHFPTHPVAFAAFGLKALCSASFFSGYFKTEEAKGLWAGMAAHSLQPLTNLTTSAIGLVLSTVGHMHGWPVPKGGSVSIANALLSYFTSIGGKTETGRYIKTLKQLPETRAVLFDVTPRQLLEIAGYKFDSVYKWQLEKFRYGMGVFKIDWALDGPVPFTAPECKLAGTVHIGNTFREIALSEHQNATGTHPEKPFVLLAQQSLFDSARAPEGKHTLWGYSHVPHGSTKDMTSIIENQVERFAPGFKDRILARHTYNTAELEAYNPNYIGGDIGGGVLDLPQLFTRPALRSSPFRTSAKGIYICSSSTPPGGGVHGMCGFHAAERVLKDIFPHSLKEPVLS